MELFQRCGVLLSLMLLLGTTEATEDEQIVGTEKNHGTYSDMQSDRLVEIISVPQFTEIIVSKLRASPKEKKESNSMPYIESSQFRTGSLKTEGSKFRTMKTSTGKFDGMNEQKLKNMYSARKSDLKNAYSHFYKKSPYYNFKSNPVTEKSITKLVLLDKVTKTADIKENVAVPSMNLLPPVQEETPIEFLHPIGILPANEEYDGDSRYTHSILYGYNAGF